MEKYSDEEGEEYGYSHDEEYYDQHRLTARQSFTAADDMNNSIDDPQENIRYLKEKLSLAAQAGLSLLKDNEEMKDKLAHSSSAYAKLMEELSAERHKNRQQATTLVMEHEAKIQEMQREADEARKLTVNEIMNSRQYVKLSEKFEASQLKIKDFESKVKHLENMRLSYRSTNEDSADLEEALERSEAFAGREETLLSRVKELELAKASQEKLVDELTQKLSDLELNSPNTENIINDNNSLKKSLEKLKEQLELQNSEIEKEHELADRAIDECKRLSVQILLSSEEMSSLKNKIYKLENVQTQAHSRVSTIGDSSGLPSFFTNILNRFK